LASKRSMNYCAVALALLVWAGTGEPQSNQKRERVSVLDSPVDKKTAVRFFYDPPGDYFHKPLVFHLAEDGSPVLNTAPVHEEGRIAYISVSEMRALVNSLAHTRLAWRESKTVEVLGSFKSLPVSDDMEILVTFANGTAKAEISPKAICATLRPLDAVLKTPRALWEFQLLRLDDGCEVPGFKAEAYPDHF
jgi:hypothetical protein